MALKKLTLCCILATALASHLPAQKQTTGKASYYSDKLHGRTMSNGERYHRDSMTCAHMHYPFGTLHGGGDPNNRQDVAVPVTPRPPSATER